jgi:hypothetical protein
MRIVTIIILCTTLLAGCDYFESTTASGRLNRALRELSVARTDEERFYALDDAAKESIVLGHSKEAEGYANELLALASQYRKNWNYGNAIQDGNIVLGRIAVREGRIADARHFLEEAGKSPGSPQMNSFGPNMSLAKDLLEAGEKGAVLSYFEACRKFWELHENRLDAWSADVKAGRTPDFGPNLVY